MMRNKNSSGNLSCAPAELSVAHACDGAELAGELCLPLTTLGEVHEIAVAHLELRTGRPAKQHNSKQEELGCQDQPASRFFS